jgi:hypothetical protein
MGSSNAEDGTLSTCLRPCWAFWGHGSQIDSSDDNG